jgi:hypothetical protein
MNLQTNMKRIYLDDMRTPKEPDWVIVRSYDDFVDMVDSIGLDNISTISLDHDLGDTAIHEFRHNGSKHYKIDYDNIDEKTGYDCVKWLVNYFYTMYPERLEMSYTERKRTDIVFPTVVVHSANPIGSANMMGYINNFLRNEGKTQNCIRVEIEHTVYHETNN